VSGIDDLEDIKGVQNLNVNHVTQPTQATSL